MLTNPKTSELFWNKVCITATCWNWIGAHNSDGYGNFGIPTPTGQKTMRPHRLTYMLFVGPIPDHHELDHLCRNPSCVNPDHLEAIPHQENVLRGTGITAQNARKTHCPQGHPYNGENLGIIPSTGGRYCRYCNTHRKPK